MDSLMPQYNDAGWVSVSSLEMFVSDTKGVRRACGLHVVDGAGELARVSAAEGELAVGDSLLSRRLEGDGDDLGGDGALGAEVVGDCRRRSVQHGAIQPC